MAAPSVMQVCFVHSLRSVWVSFVGQDECYRAEGRYHLIFELNSGVSGLEVYQKTPTTPK